MFTCKDCPDRHIGCHAECEKYQRERAEHEQIKAKRNAERDIAQYEIDKFEKANAKALRKRHRLGNSNSAKWGR